MGAEDSTEVDFMVVDSMEEVSTATGFMATDTEADGSVGPVAASTPRSFVPSRHIIVVFREPVLFQFDPKGPRLHS